MQKNVTGSWNKFLKPSNVDMSGIVLYRKLSPFLFLKWGSLIGGIKVRVEFTKKRSIFAIYYFWVNFGLLQTLKWHLKIQFRFLALQCIKKSSSLIILFALGSRSRLETPHFCHICYRHVLYTTVGGILNYFSKKSCYCLKEHLENFVSNFNFNLIKYSARVFKKITCLYGICKRKIGIFRRHMLLRRESLAFS